jgi:hypothetical protein
MFKKLIYFVITAVLILSLLQISAFAKDYTFIQYPASDPRYKQYLPWDYLKEPGDTLTLIGSDQSYKTTYKLISKGTDEKGDYILCEITSEPNWNNEPPMQKKFYLPYIPHKIGTVTYTTKDGQKTEDILSDKDFSDDIVTKNIKML